MAFRLADLAERVGGRVEGDPNRLVEAVRPLESAGARDLSLLTNPRYRALAAGSGAGALLVGAAGPDASGLGKDLLVVDHAPRALARLLALFHPPAPWEPGVHPTAVLEPGCSVDPSAHVGPYAVIGAGSAIEAEAAVLSHAVVGRGCRLGRGATLHPHAVLYDGTELGAGCIVHAGAVLGADGFGYATYGGAHHKIPQVGRVVLGEGVEVGANSTIDRATLGETRIGDGTKIDNLVQVGHNVEVGRHSILCGQSGIAGSSRLGDGVVLAGQAGVAGHLEVGNGVQVAAKSAVLASLEAGRQVAGIPAVELRKWRRQAVLLVRLEDMNRKLRALERRLGAGAAVESGQGALDDEEGSS